MGCWSLWDKMFRSPRDSVPILKSIVVKIDPSTMRSGLETFEHVLRRGTAEEAIRAENENGGSVNWIIGAAEFTDDDEVEAKRDRLIAAWRELEMPDWPI